MEPGDIVKFDDGRKHHLAILLSEHGGRVWALFLTSNPSWNCAARPVTDADLEMTGHVPGRSTWLAPVVRPSGQVSRIDCPGVGRVRLEELIHEFGPDPTVLPRDVMILPPTRHVAVSLPRKSLLDVVGNRISRVDVRDPDDAVRWSMFLGGVASFTHRDTFSFVTRFPEVADVYFLRRPSVSFGVQTRWMNFAQNLKSLRVRKCVSHKDIATVMGVDVMDIIDFEEAIQCPSWKEYLFLRHAYGAVDDVGIRAEVPCWEDCILLYGLFTFRNPLGGFHVLRKLQSSFHMTKRRVDDILFNGKRPTRKEEVSFRVFFPELPFWRYPIPSLDTEILRLGEDVTAALTAASVTSLVLEFSRCHGTPVSELLGGREVRDVVSGIGSVPVAEATPEV